MAPGDFGEFSHELLVGMFGSGQIAAFNPIDGRFIHLMRDTNDKILSIDGLWALGSEAAITIPALSILSFSQPDPTRSTTDSSELSCRYRLS